MNVLIVNQHISDVLGGSEIQCNNLALGLQKRGHSIIYAATGRNRKESYKCEYPVYPLDVFNKKEVKVFLSKHKPDVIYWRYNKHGLMSFYKVVPKEMGFIFASSALTDFKYIASKVDLELNLHYLRRVFSAIKQRLMFSYNIKALSKVDAVTVLNSDYLNLSPNINSAYIANSMKSSFEYEFKHDREFIVWVANIKEQKQPEKFIDLARVIERKHSNIDFFMIGNIQDKKYLPLLSKAEKEIKKFKYLGGKTPNEVNAILNKSLFLVHTCKPEGFGNNFIQAWLQEKPTISLEFDPNGFIEKEGLGYFSGNFENLVRQADELIQNQQLRNTMGKKAKTFAQKNFSVDVMVNKVEALLKEVVDAKKH